MAVVACPSCFGRVFAGHEYCVHCGAAIVAGARCDPDLMPVRACPRCDAAAELAPRLVADTLLDECPVCGGVWLESKVFASLVESRDQQARLEALDTAEITLDAAPPGRASVPLPLRSPRQYIPCPDCRQLMNRKNFGAVSGVLVDVCKPHGIWFDSGELGRVMKFVMQGGLARARRRETEEQIREARERRSQATVLSGLHDATDAPARSDWAGELFRALFRLLR
jgi:Zn-finger nucleic acid-binding protein